MLARIALARHDADAARAEAGLARDADPLLPLPAYIEGRLLYDQGRYDDALASFAEAIAALKKPGSPRIADLHFHAGDALLRLERSDEAQAELVEELRQFPQNTRARAALAIAYHANGQPEDAVETVKEMTRITPTADTYALAARLYSTLGDRHEAEAMRAEARRGIKN
jgi:tetratricopeptide (TPR) repeat protein